MSAGLQINLAEVRNTSGTVARAVFASMQNVAEFKSWLDAFSAQDLVDLNYAADLSEANDLKSAFTDLGDLATAWVGGTTAYPLPRDLRPNARKLIATGLF